MILQELQQWKNRKNDVAATSKKHAENINCNINISTLLELIKDIQKHHNNALNMTLLFVSIYDVC